MRYIEYGKENNNIIFLLHGGGLSWWNYEEVAKSSVPYLGWEFEAVLYLWVAGGVLTGYIIAWGIYGILNSGNKEE